VLSRCAAGIAGAQAAQRGVAIGELAAQRAHGAARVADGGHLGDLALATMAAIGLARQAGLGPRELCLVHLKLPKRGLSLVRTDRSGHAAMERQSTDNSRNEGELR
jgi:hypothetical protein